MGKRSIDAATLPARCTSVKSVACGNSSHKTSSTFSPPLMPTSQSCTSATFPGNGFMDKNIRILGERWNLLHPDLSLPILFGFPHNIVKFTSALPLIDDIRPAARSGSAALSCERNDHPPGDRPQHTFEAAEAHAGILPGAPPAHHAVGIAPAFRANRCPD